MLLVLRSRVVEEFCFALVTHVAHIVCLTYRRYSGKNHKPVSIIASLVSSVLFFKGAGPSLARLVRTGHMTASVTYTVFRIY